MSRLTRSLLAVLEVFGVYVGGQLLMPVLARLLGLTLPNPLAKLTPDISSPALLAVTGELFQLLLLQYAGWFLLAVPIGWWHRRRGPAAYGLTLAGKPVRTLVGAGVVTFALGSLPISLIELVNTLTPLGETAPWRAALFQMSWTRWEFWLFSAVAGWALVPVVEELFYRGYCQRRLAEDLGDGPAILGTAALFTFSHAQYLIANVYSVSMLASLLFGALALGFVFAKTRSLLPSVTAHAILNLPVTGRYHWVRLGLMLLICLLARRQIAAAVGELAGWVRETLPRWLPAVAAVGGAGFALLARLFTDVL